MQSIVQSVPVVTPRISKVLVLRKLLHIRNTHTGYDLSSVVSRSADAFEQELGVRPNSFRASGFLPFLKVASYVSDCCKLDRGAMHVRRKHVLFLHLSLLHIGQLRARGTQNRIGGADIILARLAIVLESE